MQVDSIVLVLVRARSYATGVEAAMFSSYVSVEMALQGGYHVSVMVILRDARQEEALAVAMGVDSPPEEAGICRLST